MTICTLPLLFVQQTLQVPLCSRPCAENGGEQGDAREGTGGRDTAATKTKSSVHVEPTFYWEQTDSEDNASSKSVGIFIKRWTKIKQAQGNRDFPRVRTAIPSTPFLLVPLPSPSTLRPICNPHYVSVLITHITTSNLNHLPVPGFKQCDISHLVLVKQALSLALD